MARPDRTQLVQSVLGRGGGGPQTAGNIGAAMAGFMQAVSQAMEKMGRSFAEAQQSQARSTAQSQQQVAQAAAQIANQSQRQGERIAAERRQEARQNRRAEENREYQLDVMEYQQALSQQVQRESQELANLVQQEEKARNAYLDRILGEQATLKQSNDNLEKWVYEVMDANGYWDNLPDGPEIRNMLLDSIRMSRATEESLSDPIYADRANAIAHQAVQSLLSGDEEYPSLVGVKPDRPMVPIPNEMVESLGVDVPVLSEEEIADLEKGKGYPKSGVWAMQADDPRFLLVNPVSYRFITSAKVKDQFLAAIGSEKVKQEAMLQMADQYADASRYFEEIDKLESRMRDTLSIRMESAIDRAFDPSERTDSVDDVLYGMYGALFEEKPELAQKMRALSLSPGHPDRWEPSSAEDFADIIRIKAADEVVRGRLEAEMANPAFKAKMVQWLQSRTPREVYNLGLPDDVANNLVYAIQNKDQWSMFSEVAPDEIITARERAVRHLWSKIRVANMENVTQPSRDNMVIEEYRESLHALRAGQDALATSFLSTLNQGEREEMRRTGSLPESVGEQLRSDEFDEAMAAKGVEQNPFRAPMGMLQSITTILGERPGARTELMDYMRGGPTKAEEDSLYSPENPYRAYYENAANQHPFRESLPPSASARATEAPDNGYNPRALHQRMRESRERASRPDHLYPQRGVQGGTPPTGQPAPQGQPMSPSVPPATAPPIAPEPTPQPTAPGAFGGAQQLSPQPVEATETRQQPGAPTQ